MNLKEIKDAARQAFSDQQTQDTEGGVPDMISFCAGFLAGARYRQEEIDELERLADNACMSWHFKCEELEAQNAKLRDALKYYASDHSWEGREVDGDDWHDFYEDGNGIGGKLARQVLKEIGE
jgi:hypothetical protein